MCSFHWSAMAYLGLQHGVYGSNIQATGYADKAPLMFKVALNCSSPAVFYVSQHVSEPELLHHPKGCCILGLQISEAATAADDTESPKSALSPAHLQRPPIFDVPSVAEQGDCTSVRSP
ncbi:hypothetical protein cyc_05982 [Cyclospora cayetanensis]|uniref:Uncharacterized protein n=1 Tax=Cyclospora cayetanensis TaxID=88456 RepID=A0A1D3DAB7_9EIME|nr:hypothetical protein cyc_05982 [Cyclospora cayetanensis]